MEGLPALAFKGAKAALAAAQYDPVRRKFFQPPRPHTGAFLWVPGVEPIVITAAQGPGGGVVRLQDRDAGEA